MPLVGYGVFQVTPEECEKCIPKKCNKRQQFGIVMRIKRKIYLDKVRVL